MKRKQRIYTKWETDVQRLRRLVGYRIKDVSGQTSKGCGSDSDTLTIRLVRWGKKKDLVIRSVDTLFGSRLDTSLKRVRAKSSKVTSRVGAEE